MQRAFIIVISVVIVFTLAYLFLFSNSGPTCPQDAKIIKSETETIEAGDQVEFALSTLDSKKPQNFQWYVDEYPLSEESNLIHVFPDSEEDKSYMIKVLVNGVCEIKEIVEVKAPYVEPKAEAVTVIISGPSSVKVNDLVKFEDKSLGETKTWEWDFGDGNRSEQQNPNHRYRRAGTYEVKLIANGNAEFASTKTVTVRAVKKKVVPKKPVTTVSSDIIKLSLNKIASPNTSLSEKNNLFKKIGEQLESNTIKVNIDEGGGSVRSEPFFNYFQELNLEGGQKILNVQVISRNAEGKISAMKVMQRRDN